MGGNRKGIGKFGHVIRTVQTKEKYRNRRKTSKLGGGWLGVGTREKKDGEIDYGRRGPQGSKRRDAPSQKHNRKERKNKHTKGETWGCARGWTIGKGGRAKNLNPRPEGAGIRLAWRQK